jgi:hypothetical protein
MWRAGIHVEGKYSCGGGGVLLVVRDAFCRCFVVGGNE